MRMRDIVSTKYTRIAESDAPRNFDSLGWLTLAERIELDRLNHALRRRQWLIGRWLAKQLIQRATGGAELADIRILARDQRGRGVRPQIRACGRMLPWSVSISHSDRAVLVALAASDAQTVGVDLADLRPVRAARSDAGFRRLWFTADEQRWLEVEPLRRTATLWALKEAVYKACNQGESWAPRQVEIVPHESGGFRCLYRGLPLASLSLTVQDLDDHVAALVQLPLHPTLPQPDRALRRHYDLPAIIRHQPTQSLPASALPAGTLPASTPPPGDCELPRMLRSPGSQRFENQPIPQRTAISRKPS